ncbi:hypothetical protein QBC47DRAFT_349501 [Echria macrotheca]|uniref:Rhodopsin domain-containing protein n=1 Tax=Echria macrotheca TaxID=438768 RepID=A0AAJ0F6U0_9PEZI|nr:hypothetical protein QBC47DRAFT_349501 [Echria macrotheca]
MATDTQPPAPSGSAAAPPPPAPDPSTLPHDSRRANLIACAVICWVIAAVFVAIRFYTRGVIIRVINWSDWYILGAVIFSAGNAVALVDQALHGSGTHVWDLDPTDTPSAIAWFRAAWYGILMYLLSLFCSKMSILALYMTLFAFRWARVGCQILIFVVVVSSLFMLLTTFTACIPLHAYWDITIPRDQVYCHAQAFWWANTGMHMITDVLIFLLPMPVVWRTLLPRRQKILLFCVFGLAFVVCFISILRLPKLYENAGPNPPTDPTWFAVDLSYLTAVEVNGAIVCACMMTLKPFVAKYFPGVLGSLVHGSTGSNKTSSSQESGGGRRGPPTIGSLPSKQPISPADSEVMGKVGGIGSSGKRGGGGGWSSSEGGTYYEIDEWGGGDVEMGGMMRKEDAASSVRSEEDVVQVESTLVREKSTDDIIRAGR